MTLSERMTFSLAQLRHAYAQLNAGTVRVQSDFANFLLAPEITRLEHLQRDVEELEARMRGLEK